MGSFPQSSLSVRLPTPLTSLNVYVEVEEENSSLYKRRTIQRLSREAECVKSMGSDGMQGPEGTQ